jgi:Coenzyme PQQ synthesis protein D (PqqD)
MDVDAGAVWRRNRAVEFRRIAEDCIQIRLTSDVGYLEGVGAFLWRHLDGTRTVADLAECAAAAYNVDRAVALADTAEFVDSLAQRSFVHRV